MIGAQMISRAATNLQPASEISWFAETGVEIGLASGCFDIARQWIQIVDQGKLVRSSAIGARSSTSLIHTSWIAAESFSILEIIPRADDFLWPLSKIG